LHYLPENMTSLLPVVLNIAPHEKRQAERLVQYLKELDGTEVITMSFQDPPGMRYPEVANLAFKQCAKAMCGKPFFWLECDVVVLKKGWLRNITDEYDRQGKPYLYAKMMPSEFDRFSGIGVQGPNAYDQAPSDEKHVGFDEVIVRTYPNQIGRTDLIQHQYGNYDQNGQVSLYEFPRDLHVIKESAVVFHKTQYSDLLKIMAEKYGIKI
jgi:hypothetical protein